MTRRFTAIGEHIALDNEGGAFVNGSRLTFAAGVVEIPNGPGDLQAQNCARLSLRSRNVSTLLRPGSVANAMLRSAFFASSAVDVLGRERGDPHMPMLGVVPCKEATAIRASLFDICEGTRESWAILERFVVRLDERIIVGHVRPRTTLYDAEVSEELRQRLRCHGCAAVAVNDKSAGINAFLFDRLRE